ncbi:hypothetical protein VNO77_15243 [Canavalia gladiata]|uniref:Uncharacterized protein n=1 Tax=Canavalia gladiata TaxID=3824 RepID=A0AAN9LZC9_CANGL
MPHNSSCMQRHKTVLDGFRNHVDNICTYSWTSHANQPQNPYLRYLRNETARHSLNVGLWFFFHRGQIPLSLDASFFFLACNEVRATIPSANTLIFFP